MGLKNNLFTTSLVKRKGEISLPYTRVRAREVKPRQAVPA